MFVGCKRGDAVSRCTVKPLGGARRLNRDLHGRMARRPTLWLRHQPAIRRLQLRWRMVCIIQNGSSAENGGGFL